MSVLCLLTVPPTVTAEANTVTGIIGYSIFLNFTLGDDADPPIHMENVTVTFTGTDVELEDHLLLQREGNVLLVTIPSLVSADAGVYKVTVETVAGVGVAETSLIVYGEEYG